MALRCPNCKTKVSRFPIRGQPDKTFQENLNEKTIIWKNLFKMDIMSIVWFIVIILLVTTYKSDIKTCREITTRPLTYCEESNACKIIEERESSNEPGYMIIDIDNIPEFNVDG